MCADFLTLLTIFLNLDLEESREGSPARYKENQPQAGPSQVESVGIDNAGLDVDFPKVFKQLQKEDILH